jgi:endonuclease/exonuclease/phosphatase (EEP) superfamily protein YafD
VPGARHDLLVEFAELVAGWEWDVALLQEVPPWWPGPLARAAGASDVSALTSRNELLPLRRALARRWPDLMKSNGGGANAILSRRGLAAQRAVRLRRLPERRVLQLARLPDGTCLANMHLSTRPPLARAELEQAWELALEWSGPAPLVFGGDLNLRDPRGPAGTVHAAARDVDHLFARGLEQDGAPAQPERGALSDHAALLVTLRAPAG